MKNTKLFTLLGTFDLKDWQQFGKYLRSPFFNQTEDLTRLADILEEFFRKEGLKIPDLEKRTLYRLLYPSESFSAADLNRLCSRLLTLATDFLAYQNWQADGIMAPYYALQVYQERKLAKHFAYAFQKARQTLEGSDFRTIHFQQQQYLLSEIAKWQLSGNRSQGFGPQVQKASDDFDQYFIAQKLQHLCSMASLNRLQPETYNLSFAEEIVRMAGQLQHISIIAIYRSLYLMLSEPEAAPHFSDLQSLATANEERLTHRELNFIYLNLINFCIGRIRYGEKDYATPLLDLYEQALQKGFLMDKGLITPWTFKNVVKLGLGLQRYSWVESFIRQYGPQLADNEREEAMHFNLADLYYHQQDYDTAQTHLREVEYSDIRYYLHGRILLAKIYYTTEAWEALDYLLSSFRIYLLRSKKMSREEKKPYLNFIRLLDKLLRSLPEKQKKLHQQIQQTPMLTARTWLLEISDHPIS